MEILFKVTCFSMIVAPLAIAARQASSVKEWSEYPTGRLNFFLRYQLR